MSENKRALEFRGRTKKLDQLNSVKANQELAYLTSLYLGLAKRVFDVEKKMKLAFPMAKAADYRSLAILRILESRFNVSKDEVQKVAVQVMIEDFDEQDAKDDQLRNLEQVLGEVAREGLFAVINLKLFKEGKELVEEEHPRSKIELGKNELFPEIDQAVIGMLPGESKRFNLNIADQCDSAEVTLIALKRAKATVKEEDQSNEQQAEQSAGNQDCKGNPGEGGPQA